jgi:hypothetical protein
MKYKLAVCCSLILVLFSCKNEDQNALLKTGRGTEKRVILTYKRRLDFMTRQ